VPELIATALVGLGGVALGALLARRHDKQATTERLLVEALNDVVGGIADVSNGVPGAQARYASAQARIALHGRPPVVLAFRRFQDKASTLTTEGRTALVSAVQQARRSLGHDVIEDDDVAMLLFGHELHHTPCGTSAPVVRQPDRE
jgi:hypothetical protein